jgi:PncC family amidohydrolase
MDRRTAAGEKQNRRRPGFADVVLVAALRVCCLSGASRRPRGEIMESLSRIADFMKARGLLLVTAESCTAGLIAARLADVPGAGDLLDCAFVVYSVEAKVHGLDVSRSTIERHGLTSEEVAREMACGALARSRANLAIANTGAADDGADGTPPGTQCYAWAYRRPGLAQPVLFTETRRFGGDRNAVREAGAEYALQRIRHYYASLARTTRPRAIRVRCR